MNRLDEPAELRRDELLDALYQLQADLKILTEQMARERNPDMADMMLHSLAYVSGIMRDAQPSLRRH